MMLHQDGSRHAGEPPLDLIVTLDDATWAIYSAFLVEEERTASTFRALEQLGLSKLGPIRPRPEAARSERSRRCRIREGA
jgi:hypothetical protein